MLNLLNGELPTNTNSLNADAIKHQLFHHYLNHKVSDISDNKIKSDKTVLECIVSSFNKEYKPETYSNNYLTFLYMCRLVSSGCRAQHWRAEGSSPRSYQYSESKNKHALIKLCLLQLVRRSIILSDKDDKP